MPDDATFLSRSRTNAGYALMQAGDAAGAREAYEAAIALDPGNVQAHHGMAAALEALGDRAASLRHFDEACRLRPVRRHAFGGTGTPLNLLLLLSARMGNLNAYPLLDDRAIAATTVFLEHADRAGLPAHDAIFNGIADADSNSSALHEAVAWLRGATVPVLNDPARVALTSRQDNAARLARIAGARVPAIARVARAELERGVGTRGIGCPLLLRSPGYHNGRHFVLVRSGGDLAAAAHALPGDDLYVIEFLDVRDDDGMVRKYRILAIAGNLYPLHLAISRDWKVHYVTAGMADAPEHRQQERRFLDDMRSALGVAAIGALQAVVSMLGLDYAGIDFALTRDGTPVIFEANASMLVAPLGDDPRWDYRRPAQERIRRAFTAMLRSRAIGDRERPVPEP